MRLVACTLVFIAGSVTFAAGMAFPAGGISPWVAALALLIGCLSALAAWRGADPAACGSRLNAWDILMLVILALVSMRSFLWLLYPVRDEWRVLSPDNLGDISFHIQLIRYLAGGTGFWPSSPILAGTPLTYPPGMDLFNALFLCLGIPVEKSLIWTGLLGAALAGWTLWRWGGAFAIAALLFNGGLAGFLLFQNGTIPEINPVIAWKNLFLSMFVTQRGLLYALPCGLFLLAVWRDEFFGKKSGIPQWVTFFLYTTLPLFNAHAFVFLSLVLASAFWVCPGMKKRLLGFVASAFVPSSVIVYFVTGRFSAGTSLRWVPGWMQGEQGWMFWAWNFGISLLLLLLLAWTLIRYRRPESLCFAGTGLFVFFLCCFVGFAPWDWDNTKLFLWAWLACAPFLWGMISGWPVPLRAATCLVLFFSGAVSLVDGLDRRHGYKLASRMELAQAAAAIGNVPPGDRIIIEPDYNNPIILLGRPVFCGYEGHLWSHGLHYQKQWNALQMVLRQRPGWEEELGEIDAQWLYLKAHPNDIRLLPGPGR